MHTLAKIFIPTLFGQICRLGLSLQRPNAMDRTFKSLILFSVSVLNSSANQEALSAQARRDQAKYVCVSVKPKVAFRVNFEHH